MTRSEINKVEGIQERATKMVIELTGLEYGDRLRELDLETRRKRGDLLQIYKIKKGFELVDLYIRE